MKHRNKIKNPKGSITLYTLISMGFFLILVSGLYINSSYKIQKQQKELDKIQKEYKKNNINEIYQKAYDSFINTETLTIQESEALENL